MSAAPSGRMMTERGMSLVEMLLVLGLGGIITTAAVSMISPTNRLATKATEASEIEEGTRSTINLLASTLRRVPRGLILAATRDSVVVALPVGMGAFCANDGSRLTAYFGLGGRPLDPATIDGYAFRDGNGAWSATAYPGTSIFSGSTPGRSACIAAGGGQAGTDADYVTFYTSTSVAVGTGFLVWDRQTFRFRASALDPTTRGFFFGATGAPLLEVAFELHPDTHFEYRLRTGPTWYPAVSSSAYHQIDAIRVVAGGLYDAQSDLLTRDIPLMNAE